MAIDANAGKLADPLHLTNIPRLVASYYALKPDPSVNEQRVSFGTSGHRGSAFDRPFNEHHILAISQAICQYRQEQDRRTAVSRDGYACALRASVHHRARSSRGEPSGGDDRQDDGYTPTPGISHAILSVQPGT